MILSLYSLLLLILIIAWNYNGIKKKRYNIVLFSIITLLI